MQRLASFLLLAACTSTPTSGFLANTGDLKARPGQKSQRAWFKPGIDLRDYDGIMIEPIEVRLNPNSKAGALGAATLREASEEFRSILVETLGPYYTVEQNASIHVLRVRAAITDIVPSGGRVGLGAAAMEAELLNPETGERLAAVIDRIEGTKEPADAFREWARRLLDFIDSHDD